MPELLIATNNKGKFAEFGRLLSGLDLTLRDLSYFEIADEVSETGDTFADNASLKAVEYARLSGVPALADDSGLSVDILDGAPGVHSARFAGSGATDADRIDLLLSQINAAAPEQRTARFICVVALAAPSVGVVATEDGVCEGQVIRSPRGDRGFGYDPIFLPRGFDLTFAELGPDVKDRISHRARAVSKIIPFLRGFLEI